MPRFMERRDLVDAVMSGLRPCGSAFASSATAKDAKCGFGGLIDPTRAEPGMLAKRGRRVVVVMAVEEFERLKSEDTSKRSSERT